MDRAAKIKALVARFAETGHHERFTMVVRRNASYIRLEIVQELLNQRYYGLIHHLIREDLVPLYTGDPFASGFDLMAFDKICLTARSQEPTYRFHIDRLFAANIRRHYDQTEQKYREGVDDGGEPTDLETGADFMRGYRGAIVDYVRESAVLPARLVVQVVDLDPTLLNPYPSGKSKSIFPFVWDQVPALFWYPPSDKTLDQLPYGPVHQLKQHRHLIEPMLLAATARNLTAYIQARL